MRAHVATLTALLVAACGDNLTPPVPGSCDSDPDPRCEHPIDRLLVPALRARGVPLADAPADELCRRVFLDLIDRGPTLDERAACLRDPFEDVVDRLLADPAHERTWRARWSELLGFDLYISATQDVIDLDARVGAMVGGELSYTGFASAVAWHPAFWALHKENEWATALYAAFLGRPARADEVAGLQPLTRIWRQRIYAEGGFWFFQYAKALREGRDEIGATAYANQKAPNGAKAEWGVDMCGCGGGEGVGLCASDTLGERVAFSQLCNADGVHVHRTREFTPGQDAQCPNGTHRAECADRLTDFLGGYMPIEPWPALADDTRHELDGIGRALGARHDFWDAAADRELRWLLGWWQTTFVRPDSDLPSVRALLATTLRAGASPRDIDRMILTSLLYRLPASPPIGLDAEELPPWAMGPTKLLAGEGWLRTAANAVGETVAPCDHRFVVRGGWNAGFVNPRFVAMEPSSVDALLGPTARIDASIALGGCDGDTTRPVISNLGLTYAQGQLARPLCAYGSGVLPAGWDGSDLGIALDHLAATILSRRLGVVERSELVADMHACRSVGDVGDDQGCVDEEAAVRWMCRRMLDSVEFGTY